MKIVFFIAMLLFWAGVVSAKVLKIGDFESGLFTNNLGGQFGAWESDPADNTQGCSISFSDKESYSGKFSLSIDYDVDSINPAYNGFWLKLGEIDAQTYNQLVFFVKGDFDKGFSTVFKVELKTLQEMGSVKISGINANWQKVVVPFPNFTNITNWKEMTEFVIVFDDLTVDEKVGAIYIDDVYFSDGKAELFEVKPQKKIELAKKVKPRKKIKNRKVVLPSALLAIKEKTEESGFQVISEEGKISVVLPTNFANNSADIVDQDKAGLAKVAEVLKGFPNVKISIEAHTDFVGKLESNFVLSEKRAQSVQQYLVDEKYFDEQNLSVQGWGEINPLATNLMARGRAKNRRIEFVITE
ncbi:MAG: OmpA family protein [Elusimicrobiota bacterium]